MAARVFIIGGGGREHALAWKLKQSSAVSEIFIAPGNGGTGRLAHAVPIAVTNITELATWAKQHHIDLVVVGPDNPLALGLVDALNAAGIPTFGPRRDAAMIEWSKVFAKQLMTAAGIPTAPMHAFRHREQNRARDYLHVHGTPVVLKTDGLAFGKGVYPCVTITEAQHALATLFRDFPYQAVLIEDFLTGPEVSLHAICSRTTALSFPPAQDYKRIGAGDTGPNTGGMGVVTPLPGLSTDMTAGCHQQVIMPTLAALVDHGISFTGCLYPGLILTPDGFRVLEFNARFGDPEIQSYLRLLKNDLFELLLAAATGSLGRHNLHWRDCYAVCIVLAAPGYPESPRTGDVITGLDAAVKLSDVQIFHAGTVRDDSIVRTAGGRVLNVTAIGDSLQQTLDRAYAAVDCISFPGMQYRRDIGHRAAEPARQWAKY